MHARCEVQKCVSYVDPERYPERNLNDTLNDTPCVAWKAKKEPTQPSSRPSPQVAGFTSAASQQTAHQNQQPFPMHTLDFASGRSRNTSVASQQTAHQNQQPFPMHTLDFASGRSRNTSVASQQTPNQNQPFPMRTLDFASSRSRNTSVASQQTPNQNQPFPM